MWGRQISVGQEGRVVRHDCPNGTGKDGTQRNKKAQVGKKHGAEEAE